MNDMPHVTGIEGFLGFIYVCIAVISFWYGAYKTIKAHKEPYYITLEKEPEDPATFCDNDWNVICRSAIEGAKAGNSSDRKWVMENVISSHEADKEETGDEKPETSKQMINDSIATLRSMGHKAAEAKKLDMDLVSKKVYHNAEELLVDVYKR